MNAPEQVPTARPRAHPALDWWKRLRDPSRGDPGALARLRRARSTLEAMQVPQALELARRLSAVPRDGRAPDWRLRAALDLARVLAHIREHDPANHPMRAAGWKRFAAMRRESDAGEDRPRLAEARFRRLLLTGGGEEKVSAFTRLVVLLDGTARVDDVARDFIAWNDPDRGDAVRERWAFLYYRAGDAALPELPEMDPNDDPLSEDDA